MKLLEYEPTARDREKIPAEAHAQHYVIMTADQRKMKGRLKQPLEKASSVIVQHGWQRYYLKWGGLKQERNEWKDRQFLAEYVSFPSHSKGTFFFFIFILHSCNTHGGEDVRQSQECEESSLWKLQENEIIHIISHLLIRENPTVKRQEMKPGNKFHSCSCESKFIFLLEQNSISSPWAYVHDDVWCIQ